MKPLLRWAGGKRRLLPKIVEHVPKIDRGGRFIELFAGGAALFFHLEPRNAVLVDLCKPLMAFYEAIQREPVVFSDELDRLLDLPFGEATYLSIREGWDGNDFGVKFASRLMYLNKLGFNGLFRLNKNLKFNVPWGKKPQLPVFPSRDEILAASDLLKSTTLHCSDYAPILRATHAHDVVYADPPYINTFSGYTGSGFSEQDQKDLADSLHKAALRGVTVISSNLDCPAIREMYGHWAEMHNLKLLHSIGASTESRKVRDEVLMVAKAPWKDPRQVELPL